MMQPIHQPSHFAWNESAAASSSFNGTVEQENQHNGISTTSNEHIVLDMGALSTAPICRDARRSGGTFVMKYLVPTLLMLVATKYQVHPDVLFSKTAFQLWTFVASTCVYCATLEILKDSTPMYERYYDVFDFIALICKLFSITALVTILLPSRLSLPVFIASTSLIAFILVVRLIYARFKTKLVRITTKLWVKLSRSAMDMYTKLCGRLSGATMDIMKPV